MMKESEAAIKENTYINHTIVRLSFALAITHIAHLPNDCEPLRPIGSFYTVIFLIKTIVRSIPYKQMVEWPHNRWKEAHARVNDGRRSEQFEVRIIRRQIYTIYRQIQH